jgi:hypothetical protein
MSIAHADLEDPFVHEPKGISTAASGNVYVANGSGSGSWSNNFELVLGSGDNLELDKSSLIVLNDGSDTPFWRDLVGELVVRGTGANDPAWTQITGSSNMWGYSFSASTMMQFWSNFHVDHDYASGTPIYMHVHWFNPAATPNTGTVRWGFEYTVAKGHNQQAFGFASTTTVYIETACPSTRYQHMISEIALSDAIPSTNLEPDSIIHVRMFRDAAHSNDTCTDAVWVSTSDCHYQANRFGTKNKAPAFNT